MPTGRAESTRGLAGGMLARPVSLSAPHAMSTAEQLPASVTAPTGEIEAYLERVTREAGLPRNLTDAMLYSLMGPGKRARPLLVWHSCAAAGGDPATALPAAAALELVHCFSLVHDDLPALDNDDLRRGRPTLHKHAGEAMAVLAGDALLTLAFQVLAERCPPLAAGAMVKELAVSTNAMIAGQVFDTLGGFPAGLTDSGRLELVHRNKTGMLIRAACRLGAMSALHGAGAGRGDGGPDRLAAITAYAEAIGLMFQVVDDLLDVTQTTSHLGKKAGKDAEAGKLTYPGVFGIEHSRAEVARLHGVSLAALEPLGPAADPLRALASYMAVRTR
jgi:geranylgeranyl diphosphate synthase, type II